MAVQTLLMSELEKQEERLTPRGAAAQMEAQMAAAQGAAGGRGRGGRRK